MLSLAPLTLQHEFACVTRMCINNLYEPKNTFIPDSIILYLWYSAHLSTFQSTLELVLCCHLFDYTWSVALLGKSFHFCRLRNFRQKGRFAPVRDNCQKPDTRYHVVFPRAFERHDIDRDLNRNKCASRRRSAYSYYGDSPSICSA